ncbi:hypothetical protein B0H14DRAFT_3483329 [Mycena olivaceomarginata]|nr:hypothetical protein B0H14DRAFT_3483329 [Mycena olivaceomarginata]
MHTDIVLAGTGPAPNAGGVGVGRSMYEAGAATGAGEGGGGDLRASGAGSGISLHRAEEGESPRPAVPRGARILACKGGDVHAREDGGEKQERATVSVRERCGGGAAGGTGTPIATKAYKRRIEEMSSTRRSYAQICFLTDTAQPLRVFLLLESPQSLSLPLSDLPRRPDCPLVSLSLPRPPSSIAPPSSSRVCLVGVIRGLARRAHGCFSSAAAAARLLIPPRSGNTRQRDLLRLLLVGVGKVALRVAAAPRVGRTRMFCVTDIGWDHTAEEERASGH